MYKSHDLTLVQVENQFSQYLFKLTQIILAPMIQELWYYTVYLQQINILPLGIDSPFFLYL